MYKSVGMKQFGVVDHQGILLSPGRAPKLKSRTVAVALAKQLFPPMLQNPATNQTGNESLSDNDAMSLLSTYMLQGWVMTDQACTVPGCPVPIMRSKDGSIKFCVKHDRLPTSSSSSTAAPKTTTTTTLPTSQPVTQSTERDELAERERRREQSSKASQLIGQRLLQRWTLLNETCPNPSCYAIPLMRDPARHMVCVICERTYNDDLEEENLAKETEDEPTEYKGEPTDDDDVRPETDSESYAPPVLKPARKEVPKTTRRDSRKEAFPDINIYTSPIANKMEFLLRRVERSTDPVELKQLFEAIQAGAGAIKACSEASEACHKVSNKLELDY
ncbi:hypothetical protein BJV82DRAFT_102428 [Fennellomyces sp. T-0311]|nr:hypothetical protein BJV82DRAFT_102428 [Fennellomyces sp. T-0311]